MNHMKGAFDEPVYGMQDPYGMGYSVKEKLHGPRSTFAHGTRVKLNVVPMFINIVVPWTVFCICYGLVSFRMMHDSCALVWTLVAMIFIVILAMVRQAIWTRRYDPEPSWLSYASAALLVAAMAGTILGLHNYDRLARHYYETMELKTVKDLDASKEQGQNMMDAGLVTFTAGSHISTRHSWHFMRESIYCVAPIIVNNKEPETQTYDFWAVGKDCCSMGASDFRCSENAWNGRSGLRVTNDQDLGYYGLAVQQASGVFKIQSKHPIFFYWVNDAHVQATAWKNQAFKQFCFASAIAFVCSIFFTCLAVYKFAWLGRGSAAYTVTAAYTNSGYNDGGAYNGHYGTGSPGYGMHGVMDQGFAI